MLGEWGFVRVKALAPVRRIAARPMLDNIVRMSTPTRLSILESEIRGSTSDVEIRPRGGEI
jgi:hypothetical protein